VVLGVALRGPPILIELAKPLAQSVDRYPSPESIPLGSKMKEFKVDGVETLQVMLGYSSTGRPVVFSIQIGDVTGNPPVVVAKHFKIA
jgi:hypothetical protein